MTNKEFNAKARRFSLANLLVFDNEKSVSAYDTRRVTGYERVRSFLERCDRRGRFQHLNKHHGVSPTGFGRVGIVTYRQEGGGSSVPEEWLSYGNYLKMGRPEVIDVSTKYSVRKR